MPGRISVRIPLTNWLQRSWVRKMHIVRALLVSVISTLFWLVVTLTVALRERSWEVFAVRKNLKFHAIVTLEGWLFALAAQTTFALLN